MGLAQQAAMFGQGLIGQGMPMKTGQNPAAFNINPAMLAVAGHCSCRSIECWSFIYYGPQAAMAQQHSKSPMFSRDYTTRKAGTQQASGGSANSY
ncbi:hypothetical protein KSP39_PZI014173 [Platanthera zijinensis]|uniref:Uncharacterized protein n=1 Tax=Platanthera zijinensis TaxID=2320716 RepID=A0AAP0BEB2_9ASPA